MIIKNFLIFWLCFMALFIIGLAVIKVLENINLAVIERTAHARKTYESERKKRAAEERAEIEALMAVFNS